MTEPATKQDLAAGSETICREIGQAGSSLLKWQTGIGVALGCAILAGFGGLAYIMARGFHLSGF